MGKYALILVVGFTFSTRWAQNSLNDINGSLVDAFVSRYAEITAKTIANSTARMSILRISEIHSWRDGYADIPIGDGLGYALIKDHASDSTLIVNRVRIRSWGQSGTVTDSVVVVAVAPSVPVGIVAVITANASVTNLGNLMIDGRDHDLTGNLIPGQGTFGVSTAGNLDQSGASVVGGTAGGVDFFPAKPGNPAVIEEYITPLPQSPDALYGYPEGTLKSVAQSGIHGSQYVTDPAALSMPLKGVTYVELDSAGVWQAIDFANSEGVLVVHNAWSNAKVKDLNGGVYKGLIIADDVEKIHATIIGGIVALSETPSGNCIGNGTGDVLYSSAALLQGASVSAGGDGGVTVLTWFE